MNLYAIEDGDRIQGDIDDRDLYVVAHDTQEAIYFWREHYGLIDKEEPHRIWKINKKGGARALDWHNTDDMEDVTP